MVCSLFDCVFDCPFLVLCHAPILPHKYFIFNYITGAGRIKSEYPKAKATAFFYSQCCCLLFYCLIILLLNYFIVLLFYHFIVLLLYCFTVLLLYCFVTLLLYYIFAFLRFLLCTNPFYWLPSFSSRKAFFLYHWQSNRYCFPIAAKCGICRTVWFT